MVRKLINIFVCFLLMMFIAGITGCEQEGAMEKTGKAIDETVEDTEKAVDDAKKDVEKSIDKQKDNKG